ncbi:Globin [Seminavis robusta]|uniref:Globin n=1 Tax=Seminavis robusta TaxID=568900 RepID=A0A9N8HCA6_9STRA|nr:Globin [Seminavis robusta]|eukprot:Sro293_g110090.1 Globin (163) ;mRNA; r:74389-75326
MSEHLEMEYETIQNVIDSWELLRRIPNYDVEAGTLLFTHLFEKCPPAMVLFGFPKDMDPTCEKLKKSKRFVSHAKNMVAMLDRALAMLGPDAELLEEMLLDLGKKHVTIGVPVNAYPIMGDALLQTLRELLGDKFNQQAEHSWLEVYRAFSFEMISVMRKTV